MKSVIDNIICVLQQKTLTPLGQGQLRPKGRNETMKKGQYLDEARVRKPDDDPAKIERLGHVVLLRTTDPDGGVHHRVWGAGGVPKSATLVYAAGAWVVVGWSQYGIDETSAKAQVAQARRYAPTLPWTRAEVEADPLYLSKGADDWVHEKGLHDVDLTDKEVDEIVEPDYYTMAF